jgi:hypothetical protein
LTQAAILPKLAHLENTTPDSVWAAKHLGFGLSAHQEDYILTVSQKVISLPPL